MQVKTSPYPLIFCASISIITALIIFVIAKQNPPCIKTKHEIVQTGGCDISGDCYVVFENGKTGEYHRPFIGEYVNVCIKE